MKRLGYCKKNCSNNGKCIKGKCICSKGFYGTFCKFEKCQEYCNKRGQCKNGRCICNKVDNY